MRIINSHTACTLVHNYAAALINMDEGQQFTNVRWESGNYIQDQVFDADNLDISRPKRLQ